MSNSYPANKPRDVVLSEAKAFVDQYYSEHVEHTFDASEDTDSTKATDGVTKATDAIKPRAQRWDEIEAEIASTGTYTHTFDELDYGAKLAWRNSNRCIGRLFWKTLKLLDFRAIQTEREFLNGLNTHLTTAERRSKIRSTISVFPPAGNAHGAPVFRIENYTLLMYAGYQSGGSNTIIGDPKNVEFTKRCKDLGWDLGRSTGGEHQQNREPGNFDLLPVVYTINGGPAKWHQIPESQVSEVPITHPEHKWFEELCLRWYKLPVISHMTLDIGGIEYPAAPFNGWYMLDEVATRNFGDAHRYNQLPVIANRLGLDRSSPFWKEKALLVLNEAVYHSYGEAGATIVDHHTAVEQFMKFMEMEHGAGREVTGDWSWLIPPTSSSTTAIFHTNIDNRIVLPNFLG